MSQRNFLVAGVVGVALCGASAVLDPPAALASYLAAYLFWLGIALGSLAIVMLHYLTGGFWGFLIRRPLEASMMTLPLMGLLFLPLLIDPGAIYPWARPSVVAADEALRHKQPYLNVGFFAARAAIYFVIWVALALIMNLGSKRQDRTEDPTPTRRAAMFAAPGLVLYFLSMTFAAVDWGMSLEPDWYSTIYGVMLMIGQGLSTLSAMVLVASFLARTRALSPVAQPDVFHDVGNLMLAFTMLWAYMSFSQYLIIWYGNLIEEIPWYLHRSVGAWRYIAASLILFHFFLPFFLLLNREAKRQPEGLWKIAAWILFIHAVNDAWLVLPSLHTANILRFWAFIPAFVGIGGLWGAAFTWQLKGKPLVPRHDPMLAEALVHHGVHHL
jgi:predicted secreted protein